MSDTQPKDPNKDPYDAIIVGGGLAGLTLSCLLAAKGIKLACIDRDQPSKPGEGDTRTTAISYGSRQILEEAGIWQTLETIAAHNICPIEDIRILDGDSPLLLNFLSAEVEDKAFGWIVPNADLKAAMLEKLGTLKQASRITGAQVNDFEKNDNTITAHYTTNKDQAATASLIIGADGRRSFVRDYMNVHTREWTYNQTATVCIVNHEHPHLNKAVEHFWPEGPFAILPMSDDENGNHRSSVVFTEHGKAKKSYKNDDDETFNQILNDRFPPEYGHVQLTGKRASYPLNLVHASEYIAPRMVLVADAAHGIHPIAGQGLNLGFRDIKALSDILSQAHTNGEDLGAPEILETYQRKRRFDNMTMAAVTDGLARLFSNNIPPIRILRRVGLKLVSKLHPAKQFFMKQAMGDRS